MKMMLLSPKSLSLAGCMADGATYKEALENAEVVVAEWIETAKELGRPIPEAKGRLTYA
jgi:predicted RNase H-like HicB family nuclease